MHDNEIIELFFSRDEQAVSQCSAKYGSYCMTVADHILSDREDAAECVNDTWLAAWNTIPPERPRFLKNYLAGITRNTALSLYRKKHAQKRGTNTGMILDELLEITGTPSNVQDDFDRSRLAETINAFLVQQKKNERSCFVRRYYFCEEIGEIASRYGMSKHAVTVTLSRIRSKLRDHLRKEGYEV